MTPEQALAAKGLAVLPQPNPAELSSALPVKSKVTYPDGLTVREVDVLRLVAQGMTDAHIAEQLIISPRTVNTHLTSIYGKIQVLPAAGLLAMLLSITSCDSKRILCLPLSSNVTFSGLRCRPCASHRVE